MTPDTPSDPIRLEIYKHLFAAIAEEMGVVLRKASYSPNIKERRDFSCAVFDAAGAHDRAGRPHPGPPGLDAALRGGGRARHILTCTPAT